MRYMSISSEITKIIMDMLSDEGYIEIQRNEFAESVGCVPSQINYVISSRFTPEQGYIVESRRGGGGYIRITRAKFDKGAMLMHLVNSIGDSIDERTCRANIYNLSYQNIIDEKTSKLLIALTSDNCYRHLPNNLLRNQTRAKILKQVLLNTME